MSLPSIRLLAKGIHIIVIITKRAYEELDIMDEPTTELESVFRSELLDIFCFKIILEMLIDSIRNVNRNFTKKQLNVIIKLLLFV